MEKRYYYFGKIWWRIESLPAFSFITMPQDMVYPIETLFALYRAKIDEHMEEKKKSLEFLFLGPIHDQDCA